MLEPESLEALSRQLQEINLLLPELEIANQALLEINGNGYDLAGVRCQSNSPIETAYLQLQYRTELVEEVISIVESWGYDKACRLSWTVWACTHLGEVNLAEKIKPWQITVIATLHSLLEKLFVQKQPSRSVEEARRLLKFAAATSARRVSREDLATLLGVSRARIRLWIHRGNVEETEEGIPVAQAWELLQKVNRNQGMNHNI